MLKYLLTTAPLAALLVACSDPVQEAQEAVNAALGIKGTTEISEAVEYPSGVLCGRYENFDRWGESTGRRHFIYFEGEVNTVPNQQDRLVFCSETPRQVVEEDLGLPLTGNTAKHTAAIVADLTTLSEALERYYEVNGGYPTTEQGLQVLIKQPSGNQPAANFPEGGYLDKLPVDPWQQPYRYEGPAWGRVKSPYTLWTAGADNTPGGSGAATDINAQQLKYLTFAAGQP
ncbi:type II secretion system protein GspG [Parahaliea aestuarii]|uniref:Type II secretion system protein GspG C-terminal domain-containing protein n=1 Tax=Parahaliea aestuarii TaxID=1852021 RepID=A0A5C9A1P4_9GAMM|nr:type II secretion system protein GspG [Parahaliea aestuarii]TXS93547.1 hypothetical protein FVW59_06910 [Parahaliea aestuarii]